MHSKKYYKLRKTPIKNILDMHRALDIIFAISATVLLCIPLIAISLFIKATSTGPILFCSDRVGRDNKLFKMPKFRTMQTGIPNVASHLLDNPEDLLTPIGGILRKFSLDEFPQLWSIIKGDMSFVGPRPALYNQSDLIQLRTQTNVHTLLPGLTGWAQVNGRDELTIEQKVAFDTEYLHKKSVRFDIYILWLTLLKVLNRSGVSH